MVIVGAGLILLVLALVARCSPSAAVFAVCVLGGLQANGIVALPTPAPVRDAAAAVSAHQDRAVTALSCRQLVLTAEEDVVTAADAACSAPAR